MNIFRSLDGMAEAELTSGDICCALDDISAVGIQLWNVVPKGELGLRFWVRRRDWRKLKSLEDRKGNTLRLLKRRGLYWTGKGVLGRPVLVAGMALLLALALLLPSRIYFIRVEGNQTVPERLILETAAQSGIGFGASRRQVRSEKMKNKLLSALPELQWAGVNTYGCVAVISVKERSQVEEDVKSSEVSSMVAVRDGVVLSCTATRGDLRCAPGQAVTAGDVLISGYTDCGLTVTATQAAGEVYAQTRRILTMVTPTQCRIRGAIVSQRSKFSLVIGKKCINFYKGSGIWDTSCDKIETRYQLTLPGGFQLPVTLVKEVETIYATTEAKGMNASFLETAASGYLKQSMVAGSILHSDTAIAEMDGCLKLTGEYACAEMIGRMRQEIGVHNGKTN